MASNNSNTKSNTPQFVCQSCGNFLQHDSSLETIDDQIMKPISNDDSDDHFYSHEINILFQYQVQQCVTILTMNYNKAAYVYSNNLINEVCLFLLQSILA